MVSAYEPARARVAGGARHRRGPGGPGLQGRRGARSAPSTAPAPRESRSSSTPREATPPTRSSRSPKEQGADLIVIGSNGMQGARRVLGSVPNKVSHQSPCDVLIVQTPARPAPRPRACRPARRGTARPPPPAGGAGARPSASEPSARTMRCQGTSGSSARGEHGAREARRARARGRRRSSRGPRGPSVRGGAPPAARSSFTGARDGLLDRRVAGDELERLADRAGCLEHGQRAWPQRRRAGSRPARGPCPTFTSPCPDRRSAHPAGRSCSRGRSRGARSSASRLGLVVGAHLVGPLLGAARADRAHHHVAVDPASRPPSASRRRRSPRSACARARCPGPAPAANTTASAPSTAVRDVVERLHVAQHRLGAHLLEVAPRGPGCGSARGRGGRARRAAAGA